MSHPAMVRTLRGPGKVRRLTVIAIDDNPQALAILRAFVRVRLPQLDLTLETRGARALDAISRGGADGLVCDWEIPGLSGREIVSAAQCLDPTLPIAVFTGTDTRLVHEALHASQSIPVFSKTRAGINDLLAWLTTLG